jgi:hypothetical protein
MDMVVAPGVAMMKPAADLGKSINGTLPARHKKYKLKMRQAGSGCRSQRGAAMIGVLHDDLSRVPR